MKANEIINEALSQKAASDNIVTGRLDGRTVDGMKMTAMPASAAIWADPNRMAYDVTVPIFYDGTPSVEIGTFTGTITYGRSTDPDSIDSIIAQDCPDDLEHTWRGNGEFSSIRIPYKETHGTYHWDCFESHIGAHAFECDWLVSLQKVAASIKRSCNSKFIYAVTKESRAMRHYIMQWMKEQE